MHRYESNLFHKLSRQDVKTYQKHPLAAVSNLIYYLVTIIKLMKNNPTETDI
jgi:hypothetical protein